MGKSENGDKASAERLKRKVYERELATLQCELVMLQDWVRREGQKICIVFEGRDGAGKGGAIKAITDRVSPRTFRVVALPTPTEREKSQMFLQRYVPHLPAASEVVIFDRSWYNRAGVERVMGFCTEEQVEVLPRRRARRRAGDDQIRHHPPEILARSQSGRADETAGGPDQRRPKNMEAFADGFEILFALV